MTKNEIDGIISLLIGHIENENCIKYIKEKVKNPYAVSLINIYFSKNSFEVLDSLKNIGNQIYNQYLEVLEEEE